MRPILAELRAQGKKLFVTSNFHVSWMEHVMAVTLGGDWEHFFDQSFASCRKPLFQYATAPFFEYSTKTPNMKGTELSTVD